MEAFLNQLLSIVTNYPGNLTYHLVVSFGIALALGGAYTSWKAQSVIQFHRMTLGLLALLLFRLALYIATGILNQTYMGPQWIMPVIERAVNLLSLFIILWLWLFPEPSRPADAALGLLSLTTIAWTAFSLSWWFNQNPETAFNTTWISTTWDAIGLAVSLLGLTLLYLRKPTGYDFGFGIFLLFGAGYLAELFLSPPESDYPALLRLVQMAAYPLLGALPLRYIWASQRIVESQPQHSLPASELDAGFASLTSWLQLFHTQDTPQQLNDLLRLVAQNWSASLCILLQPLTAETSAYQTLALNRDRQEFLTGLELPAAQIPIVANALRRQRPLRLMASSRTPDITIISQAYQTGSAHLLAAPLSWPGLPDHSGLVLLSGENQPGWTRRDQDRLVSLLSALSQVFTHNTQFSAAQSSLDQLRSELASAARQAADSEEKRQQLAVSAQELQLELEQSRKQIQGLKALLTNQEDSSPPLTQLQDENARLLAQIQADSPKIQHVHQLEGELEQALSQLARLQKYLSDADQRLLESQSAPRSGQPASASTHEYQGMVASIAQDLRHPMSSVVGYTDLLLGESLGILGAAQRKFLERIKASTERMAGLIDELIQVSSVDREHMVLAPTSVDLNLVIDEALAVVRPELREKNITLRLDLPEDLPTIQADQDALGQILIHLLQNAGQVSPPEGEITFRVRLEEDEKFEQAYVLFQVTDSGEGILPEELSRVFSRLYRSDKSIQGIGDNGIGLSIVKTLVEALNGRIWVDSQPAAGSTFSTLIPLAQIAASDTSSIWPVS